MTFEPTGLGENGEQPAICFLCGGHATGIGLNKKWPRWSDDPHWLCQPCADINEHLHEAKRLDLWTIWAYEGGVEAIGEFLQEKGITDLADMDDLDARMIVKAAVEGFSNRLREGLAKNHGMLPPRSRK